MNKFFFLILLGLVVRGGTAIAQTTPTRPNIVLFLVDDMGWQDCSVPFYKEETIQNKTFRTPNMERLASKGVKFTNAYANQNCTPSRVSIMTGLNVLNHHVTCWTLQKNKNSEPDALGLIQPSWNKNGLSPLGEYENAIYATPLPQVLRANGYKTIHVGKGHFGAIGTPGAEPKNLGFDANIGGTGAGHPASYYGMKNFGNAQGKENIRAVPGLEEYWGKDIFLTEALTREAIKEMDEATKNSKPFFLYMAHYAVHTPIVPDKRFVQKYYDTGLDSVESSYAALVEGMDKSLGDILNYLDQSHLAENTIIIFLSDNGGLSDVARGGVRNKHNSPLRSGKTSGYEGGLRVPMLLYWPKITKPGSINNDNVMVEDMFPTILSMAGIKSEDVIQKVTGQDLTKSLRTGQKLKSRSLTWHYPHAHNGRHPDVVPFSIIRKGDWKLMYFHLDSHFELYNTKDDISETKNLFEQEKNRARSMAVELGQLLRKNKTPMPKHEGTGEEIPFPDKVFPK